MSDILSMKWRVGRKLGRTIYAIAGDEPDDCDTLLGMMDTREVAEHVVYEHNRALSERYEQKGG